MSFKIATAYVSVEAEDSGLRADITAKVKAAADGTVAEVRVDVDGAGLAEKVKAEADAADAETHIKVKVDNNSLGDFEAEFRRAMAESDQVVASASADMRQSFSSMESGSRALRAAMADLEPQAQQAGRSLEDAGSKAGAAGKRASSAGGGFHLGAVGLGAMTASGASLIPVLAAIPAAAAAAAAGVAVLGGAFGGVTKALHDYGAMNSAVGGGGGGGQTAATAYSNAVAIRNAEQAITDARTQAARSAQQAAEQLAGAEQGVQDAERSAARAAQQAADQITAAKQKITGAAYAQQQAEQSYTNAVYNETQADQALISARQTAADQLVDSQNAAKDAHLATEQAALNADAANQALAASVGNTSLTTAQRTQLELAAQQATQQLADAKQHEKEATQAANAATAAGVDKAPTVLSAQHAAQQAAQATAAAQHGIQTAAQQAADAQAGLAKAQQAAADQQITSAEQIKNAQQSLADAERQQAQQRADSAEQIAKAEQNLTDTIKEQQLQAVSGGAAVSTAANKFAADMKALSPAGRDFVNQVISMKGEIHGLATEAQQATLPGFTQMLKDSQDLLPTVTAFIEGTGQAFSDTAEQAGKLFTNPDFDAAAMHFTQIITGGFAEVMSGLPPTLNAVVTAGAQAAPIIDAVSVGIHGILSSGLPAFLSGLSSGAGGAAQGIDGILGSVDRLLGPIGQLAGAFANAVGPAIGDLLPQFADFTVGLEKDLLPLMPQLSLDLQDAAQVMGALLQIGAPVAAMITKDLSVGLQIVDPLLRDTAKFLEANQQWLVPVAEGILATVAAVKAWNLLQSGYTSGIKAVSTGLEKLGLNAKNAATAEQDAAKAVSTTGGGLAAGLSTALPIVGAITTGAMVLGTELNKIMIGGQNASSSVDKFTIAMFQAESAANNATSGLDGWAQFAQKMGATNSEVTDSLAQTGLGLLRLNEHLGFASDDLKNFDGSLANLVSSGHADRAAAIVAQIADATDAQGKKMIENVDKAFPQYAAALDSASAQALSAATSTDTTKTAVDGLGDSAVTTTSKFQQMASTLSQSQAIDSFHAQLLGLKQTLSDNGKSLDDNTSKGLANRQAFSSLAQQIVDYAQQLEQAKDPESDVTAKVKGMVGQLEDQAGQFGYNKKQVDAYLKSIGLIPKQVTTKVKTSIDVQVNDQLLQAAALRVGHVVGHYLAVPGNAVGGLITGPGTGTSDSVLRRLSNGEYVMTADAVTRLGLPLLNQLNYGTAGGAAPAPAPITRVGGTTPMPGTAPVINLNYFGTQQPTVEQQQVMMRDLALAVRG